MSSLNQVMLIGNLGKDPDIRALNNGENVANLSVATSKRWRDKSSGEMQERTEWHRVTAFGHSADFADKYLRKGAKVYVQGELQTRKWTDRDGNDRYTTEVIIGRYGGQLLSLDRREGSGGGESSGGAGGSRERSRDDLNDDIPF